MRKHRNELIGSAFVECSNHYIRARHMFDEPYDSGKL